MASTATETKPLNATDSGVKPQRVAGQAVAADPSVLGFKWLGALFRPAPFISGVLIGFMVCCYLGYLTTLKNQFGDIQRFGIFVGPQASFFPTVRQLLAVVKSRVKHGETLVIVGGSSILNGVGQSNEQLWTRRLQTELGPKYVVVNLALRSCNSFEGAYFVAEAMLKDYEKVIFVTSSSPSGHWDPMGNPPYAYLQWDAKYNELLSNFPAREKALARREKVLPDDEWTAEKLAELKCSQFLNAHLNFFELWNTVGYKYFFTSYRSVTDAASYWPRKKLPNNSEAYEVFHMPSEEFAKSYFPGVCKTLMTWDSQKKAWGKEPAFWKESEQTIENNVAPAMRPRTLALLIYQNPALRKKYMTTSELKRDEAAYDCTEELFEKYGIAALQVAQNYTGEDFRDALHLGPSGGDKLAVQTAVEVRKLAKKLGYEK